MNITDVEAGFNTVNLRFINQNKMKISTFNLIVGLRQYREISSGIILTLYIYTYNMYNCTYVCIIIIIIFNAKLAEWGAPAPWL